MRKRMVHLHSGSQKFRRENWCDISPHPPSHHRFPTCMTEQRPIRLTAVVVSQSYSEASARDTHQL